MATARDIARDSNRAFATSHGWITFEINGLERIGWKFWELIGEARSKCRHLANTPLPPNLARQMSALYLAKAAHATTAIEGNSLSEEQVFEAVEGQLRLPVGQEYLKTEVENVLRACASLETTIPSADGVFEVAPELMKTLNREVLTGLEVPSHVVPGEFRTGSVVVGGIYRGAPAEDCEFLVSTLCGWLNGGDFASGPDPAERFLRAFLRAVMAHLYIAWVHPFGDGNGRTARLVEFGILTAAGIPSVAAHLLSNHYNQTRTAYYQQLDFASKSGGEVTRFLHYAAEGFVGELQQELEQVHNLIHQMAWRSYVFDTFAGEDTPAPRRQRALVLALPSNDWTARGQLLTLTPELALAYAGKGSKTVTRDINALLERGLVERAGSQIRAQSEIMFGFLPPVANDALR